MILRNGLPSSVNPSDHIPVGAAFQWAATSAEGLPSLSAPDHVRAGGSSNVSGGAQPCEARCPHREAAELLAACPFPSEEQRVEFFEVTHPPFELTKGKRPSAAEMEVLTLLKQRRDALFGTAAIRQHECCASLTLHLCSWCGGRRGRGPRSGGNAEARH